MKIKTYARQVKNEKYLHGFCLSYWMAVGKTLAFVQNFRSKTFRNTSWWKIVLMKWKLYFVIVAMLQKKGSFCLVQNTTRYNVYLTTRICNNQCKFGCPLNSNSLEIIRAAADSSLSSSLFVILHFCSICFPPPLHRLSWYLPLLRHYRRPGLQPPQWLHGHPPSPPRMAVCSAWATPTNGCKLPLPCPHPSSHQFGRSLLVLHPRPLPGQGDLEWCGSDAIGWAPATGHGPTGGLYIF